MISYTFMFAALVVIVTPGPDMLNSLAIGMSQGKRQGVLYALGVGVGCLVHTVLAVVGLSALVVASAPLFSAIKWLGVAYLFYLGVQALRSQADTGRVVVAPKPSSRRFFDGALTNALNPKVMLFFLAFLPQFLSFSAGSASVPVQLALMGLFFAAVTAVMYVALAWFAGRLGQRMQATPRFAQALNKATGVLFIGLALRLAWPDAATPVTPR